MTNIAGREVSTPDLALIATGVVALVDLFLPWYRVSIFGTSYSANAFDAGFAAWFGTFLIIAVGAIAAAKVFAGFVLPSAGPIGPALLQLGLAAIGSVLILLRFLTEHRSVFLGLWLGLICGLVQIYFLFLAFKSSGEALPDFGNRGTGTPNA